MSTANDLELNKNHLHVDAFNYACRFETTTTHEKKTVTPNLREWGSLLLEHRLKVGD